MSLGRLTTGGGLAAAVVKTDMEKLLECPVCTEIPVPPIYTCETGHSICNNCKSKLKSCAMCKKPYTNSRNFALEAMIQAAKFYCNQRPKGCSVTGTPDELINHHKICTFGPVKCFLSGSNGCIKAMCMSDYVEHLKNVHAIASLGNEKELGSIGNDRNRENTFPQRYSMSSWAKEQVKTKGTSNVHLLNCNNQWFLTHIDFHGSLCLIRCILIGEETEAEKYAVNITIHSDSNTVVPRFSLTTMVEPVRAVTENPGRLPRTVIQRDLMEHLGSNTSAEIEQQNGMSWNIKYEIITLSGQFNLLSSIKQNFKEFTDWFSKQTSKRPN